MGVNKDRDDFRARRAFVEAMHRTSHLDFSQDEITISEKMRIGDPLVCNIEAHKDNGDSSSATGQAYIYPDLVIVCVESITEKSLEPMYPHHYEYLSY